MRKRKTGRKPIAADLFSGCGGLTVGLKQAGFRVAAAVEIDALAVETYKANHPGVRVWRKDIRKLAAAQIKRRLRLGSRRLDVLAGCPPCQGFSGLTTLNGRRRKNDARNDLVFDFLRFVRVLRPRVVMMENVPGLLRDRRFSSFVRALESMGYTCTYGVLDAADYGVPQRRRRFILIAGERAIPFGRPSKHRKTVREALRNLPKRSKADPLHTLREQRSTAVTALIKRIPRDGGSRAALGPKRQLRCHQGFDGFHDVYGRMAWDTVAPTITSGFVNPSKGRFLHPVKNRTITLREGALLQGFPATYRFSLRRGKFPAAEMIGNALPPPFVRRHARPIYRYLQGQRHCASKG
jgi:DNA (cytosine-5)-methyltransferase 1